MNTGQKGISAIAAFSVGVFVAVEFTEGSVDGNLFLIMFEDPCCLTLTPKPQLCGYNG